MKRILLACAMLSVCIATIALAGSHPPNAQIIIVGPDAPVIPAPNGMVAFDVTLGGTLDELNGMVLWGVITPLDGGSAGDLTFDHGEIHPDLLGVPDIILDLSLPGENFHAALFAADPLQALPPVSGAIATLYYTYDENAVPGHTYELSLDQTVLDLGLGRSTTMSHLGVGNSISLTQVPLEVFIGQGTTLSVATATFTADTVTFVPEPATMLLLGAGVMGLAALRRRK